MNSQLKIAVDALNNILSYHADDNQRPKAFYIAADALDMIHKARQATQEPTGGAIEGGDVPWPFPKTKGSPVTDPEAPNLKPFIDSLKLKPFDM